jgi:hypothetical protein
VGVEYERFVRSSLTPEEASEVAEVDRIAARLLAYVESEEQRIDRAHVHGAQSSVIQVILAELLLRSGFDTEVVLTPEDGFVTHARPDFFFRLAPERGILAEVERGGAVNNNHDLKDVWKAHIAPDAQHLFLVVPNSNFREDGSPREKPFVRVVHRAASFFGDARREIDVVSMHVFGYGRSGTPGAIDSGSWSGERAASQSLRHFDGLGDR